MPSLECQWVQLCPKLLSDLYEIPTGIGKEYVFLCSYQVTWIPIFQILQKELIEKFAGSVAQPPLSIGVIFDIKYIGDGSLL